MKLTSATEAHLLELMKWFADQQSRLAWAGPKFRFPFTAATFKEDIRFDNLPSYSLVEDNGELLGFGQHYLLAGRYHLARLAISPRHRGRSLGEFLVRELCRRGCNTLKVNGCSLFVLADNAPATRLYRRVGFLPAPWPEETPQADGCLYMVMFFTDERAG